MAAVSELASTAGIQAACQELALPRSSFYRKLHRSSAPADFPAAASPGAGSARKSNRAGLLARRASLRHQGPHVYVLSVLCPKGQ